MRIPDYCWLCWSIYCFHKHTAKLQTSLRRGFCLLRTAGSQKTLLSADKVEPCSSGLSGHLWLCHCSPDSAACLPLHLAGSSLARRVERITYCAIRDGLGNGTCICGGQAALKAADTRVRHNLAGFLWAFFILMSSGVKFRTICLVLHDRRIMLAWSKYVLDLRLMHNVRSARLVAADLMILPLQ